MERDYYECHEVLEDLWLEEGRERFYQGLLQVAVGLYHFQNDNVGGARKMFRAALEKLQLYPEPVWMGIHTGKLIKETKDYLAKLEQWEKAPFPFYALTITVEDEELAKRIEERKSKERG
jgi:predicted metal-dependent hydrolase